MKGRADQARPGQAGFWRTLASDMYHLTSIGSVPVRIWAYSSLFPFGAASGILFVNWD